MTRLEVGRRIANRYRLERRIGAGGMGEVWSATHLVTEKEVAMKFVSTHVRATPLLRERLFREAKAAARVDHPSVIDILDAFTLDDDVPVIVMELLRGESLASRLKRVGALEIAEAASVMVQVVSAVGAAHARGIVHRDLKPDNVFLCEGERGPRVKVLDFGIAKLAAPGDAESGLTSLGQVLGTPAYMSPEQCRGELVDHRADMWAIGIMLYEVLAGERPLQGTTVGEVVECLLTDGIPPLRHLAPEVPFDLAVSARRLLERKPKNRGDDLRDVDAVVRRYAIVEAPVVEPARVEAIGGDERVPSDDRRRATQTRREDEAPAEPAPVDESSSPPASNTGREDPLESPPPIAEVRPAWRRWAPALFVVAAGLAGWASLSSLRASTPEGSVEAAAPDFASSNQPLDADEGHSPRRSAAPAAVPLTPALTLASSPGPSSGSATPRPSAPPARTTQPPRPPLPRAAVGTASAEPPPPTAGEPGPRVQSWD